MPGHGVPALLKLCDIMKTKSNYYKQVDGNTYRGYDYTGTDLGLFVYNPGNRTMVKKKNR